MIEAAAAILLGGLLARLILWPLEMWLLNRRLRALHRHTLQLELDLHPMSKDLP